MREDKRYERRGWRAIIWGGQRVWAVAMVSTLVAGCGDWGARTMAPVNAQSKPYRITNSFHKDGQWFAPQLHYELQETGIASCYGDGDGTHLQKTATGEVFDTFLMTAAHRTLPLPCVVLVENLENGRSARLKVNDRGPFAKNRILDVSIQAARALGFYDKGTACVRVTTLVPESVALAQSQIRRRNLRQAARARWAQKSRSTPPVVRMDTPTTVPAGISCSIDRILRGTSDES